MSSAAGAGCRRCTQPFVHADVLGQEALGGARAQHRDDAERMPGQHLVVIYRAKVLVLVEPPREELVGQ